MKLWYTMFILTFVILYGTLSFALIGGWVYAKARALRDARRLPLRGTRETGT